MTIAIGFQCNDGIVLCSDSQETISGYIKSHSGKIQTRIYESCAVSFVGSGTADYIDTAIDAAGKGLAALTVEQSGQIAPTLDDNLMRFFDQRLAPWSVFPEDQRPTVELLIGVAAKKGLHAVYHYSGTAFRQVTGRGKAIGAGILLANNLLSKYSVLKVAEASRVAVFILSKVKKEVDSCGGYSEVVLLRRGRDFGFLSGTEQFEEDLKKVEHASDESLKQQILALPLSIKWISEARKPTPEREG